MAGVPLGGQQAERQGDVVPVRADQRDTPLDLLAPPLGHRRDEQVGQLLAGLSAVELETRRGLVFGRGVVVGRGDVGVGLAHVRGQVGQGRQARGEQLAARSGEVGVPDVERAGRVGGRCRREIGR